MEGQPTTEAARNAEILRLQQRYYTVKAMPQPFWVRAAQYSWSRSFWAVPMVLPIVVIGILLLLRPQEVDTRSILLTYLIAVPVGFSLWVLAWKTYGLGTGQISTIVATTALGGWIAMHRGLWLIWIDRRFVSGLSLLLITVALMLGVKTGMERGTTPISLALVTALSGSAFPVIGLLATQCQRIFGFFYVTLREMRARRDMIGSSHRAIDTSCGNRSLGETEQGERGLELVPR